jgi:hypothetical protein
MRANKYWHDRARLAVERRRSFIRSLRNLRLSALRRELTIIHETLSVTEIMAIVEARERRAFDEGFDAGIAREIRLRKDSRWRWLRIRVGKFLHRVASST